MGIIHVSVKRSAYVVGNEEDRTERHHDVPKQCSVPKVSLHCTRAKSTWRVPGRQGRVGHSA